jgi:hypothetical protein
MAGPATILAALAPADHTATAVPGSVSPGERVAFDIHFKNTSSSNLASLSLDALTSDATPAGATLLGVEPFDRGGCDTTSGDLHCAFGALNSLDEINLRVVYTTPDVKGTFTVPFLFTTTGNAPQGKKSHGYNYPTDGVAILDDSANFAGAYTSEDGQLVTDIQVLDKNKNPQFTQVTAPESLIGVTVGEEAIGVPTVPCPAEAGTCFGQWSIISVNPGNVLDYTPPGGIEVLIGYKGTIGNAKFVHVLDDGTVQLIEDQCSANPPTAAELKPGCFIINRVGGDSFVTLWIWKNGRLSGY